VKELEKTELEDKKKIEEVAQEEKVEKSHIQWLEERFAEYSKRLNDLEFGRKELKEQVLALSKRGKEMEEGMQRNIEERDKKLMEIQKQLHKDVTEIQEFIHTTQTRIEELTQRIKALEPKTDLAFKPIATATTAN
jgi:chromosome segregation ATPase